ncbi:MAG: hypothetical protein EPN40_12180, partial [Rhodanobacteraceae bacterium]
MPPVSVAIAATAVGPSGGSTGTTGTPVQVDQTPLTVQPAIPPDVTLMLDDSLSMHWDFMPDWAYIDGVNASGQPLNANPSANDLRDSALNGVYYNPAVLYTPPPQANGTPYPASPGLTGAYKDGFTDATAVNVASYTGGSSDPGYVHRFSYYTSLQTSSTTTQVPATFGCGNGGSVDPATGQCVVTTPAPVPPATKYTCNPGDSGPSGNPPMCTHVGGTPEAPIVTTYPATATLVCPSGSSLGS